MKLRTRRIIMFGFILAFFILAPVIIFYASGYRYDFKRNIILKTGSIYIESKGLKNAKLYLNDKLSDSLFSEKKFIYNLMPGEYQIRLAKDGYFPWQKKVTIQSGITTFVQDIVLFENNIPLQIIDGQIKKFTFSPDEQKIIYLNINDGLSELWLYDLVSQNKELVYKFTSPKEIDFHWAPSSKKILINLGPDYLVIDVQNPQIIQTIKDITKFSPLNVTWDTQSDNQVYALSQSAIYKIDLLQKSSQKIFGNPDLKINKEFFLEANDLFYIQEAATQNTLFKYNFNFKTTKKILDLSQAENYGFIRSTNNFIGLIDSDNQKLFLIKKTNTDLEVNINASEPIKEFDARSAVWDDKQKQLLLYNDFEISTYNPETDEKNFINRYGQIIKKAEWYPDLSHLIILLENNLQIIDLDAADGVHQITEVVKFDHLDNFYLDAKGENIYFNGQIGKQQGLYQLKLH